MVLERGKADELARLGPLWARPVCRLLRGTGACIGPRLGRTRTVMGHTRRHVNNKLLCHTGAPRGRKTNYEQ